MKLPQNTKVNSTCLQLTCHLLHLKPIYTGQRCVILIILNSEYPLSSIIIVKLNLHREHDVAIVIAFRYRTRRSKLETSRKQQPQKSFRFLLIMSLVSSTPHPNLTRGRIIPYFNGEKKCTLPNYSDILLSTNKIYMSNSVPLPNYSVMKEKKNIFLILKQQ